MHYNLRIILLHLKSYKLGNKLVMKSESEVAQSCQAARLLCPWDSPGNEYWSGLPFPSLGDLPNSGIEPSSPALQADALSSEPPGKLVIVTAYFNYLLLNFASKINFYFYILSIFHSLKQKYSLLLTSLEGQKYVISSKRSLNNFHN